ncbi:YlxR family protein|uniref:YlxR domain-containing protein n=1 Tax=Dendrosporobacter quercicolus TaxID=146817 RepID=A0A1G9LJS9_9FIRM|nr:YlxR family protein [Dendrosporobacter quercicolus]NSL46736.1 YlxR family protein [Dendrosporobacter quercicolus DSM 1736]SDL62186.1 hypothetical protein SAMN04488502_101373 [Dendrosporobacter quercicolus]
MAQKKIPQRMCVGCQQMKNKKELLRIVRTPEEAIVLDNTGKKAGRGAYVCRNEQCFAKAFKEKRLEKAFKHAVDPDVYDQLKAGIMKE